MTRTVTTVALVGGGVIGSGWATRCLAHGLDVVVTDPAPGAEAAIRDAVQRVWPTMVEAGCAEGASLDRLTFAPDIATACPVEYLADIDVVGESEHGPVSAWDVHSDVLGGIVD